MKRQDSCPRQHLPINVDNGDNVCQERSLKPAAAAGQFHSPDADAVWAPALDSLYSLDLYNGCAESSHCLDPRSLHSVPGWSFDFWVPSGDNSEAKCLSDKLEGPSPTPSIRNTSTRQFSLLAEFQTTERPCPQNPGGCALWNMQLSSLACMHSHTQTQKILEFLSDGDKVS